MRGPCGGWLPWREPSSQQDGYASCPSRQRPCVKTLLLPDAYGLQMATAFDACFDGMDALDALALWDGCEEQAADVVHSLDLGCWDQAQAAGNKQALVAGQTAWTAQPAGSDELSGEWSADHHYEPKMQRNSSSSSGLSTCQVQQVGRAQPARHARSYASYVQVPAFLASLALSPPPCSLPCICLTLAACLYSLALQVKRDSAQPASLEASVMSGGMDMAAHEARQAAAGPADQLSHAYRRKLQTGGCHALCMLLGRAQMAGSAHACMQRSAAIHGVHAHLHSSAVLKCLQSSSRSAACASCGTHTSPPLPAASTSTNCRASVPHTPSRPAQECPSPSPPPAQAPGHLQAATAAPLRSGPRAWDLRELLLQWQQSFQRRMGRACPGRAPCPTALWRSSGGTG